MRTVKRETFREQFSKQFTEDFRWERLKYPLYYRKRHMITRHFIVYVVTAICFACGLFSRYGVILGLSLVTFLVLLFYQAKRIADGVSITRKVPKRAQEEK